GRRFTGTLKAGHQDDSRGLGGELKTGRILAEQRDQLIAHDLDDLLSGRQSRHYLLSQIFGPDMLDQVFDNVEVDVSFKQRDANLAQGLADIFFGDGALSAQVLECAL